MTEKKTITSRPNPMFHGDRCCGLPSALWNKPGSNGTCPHVYALVRTNTITGATDYVPGISTAGLAMLSVNRSEWKPAPNA